MIKYYVGTGRDLCDPRRCDGPFDKPDQAKAFMLEFYDNYMPPEFLRMTISEVDDVAMTINLYKEDDKPVTLERLVLDKRQ